MKTYEILYLIPNKYTEEEVQPIISEVEELIKSASGKIHETHLLGKRKLAYPVKNFTHGYYILSYFDIEGAELEAINNKLRLENTILRHLIVEKVETDLELIKTNLQQEGHPEVRQEKAEEKKAPKKAAAKATEEKVEDAKEETTKEKKEAKPKAKKETAKKEASDKGEKIDLDNELNKILEDKDLNI